YLTIARPRDHVWHLGFFWSWKYINGRNFWEPRDKGAVNRVVSHAETATKDGAVFEAELSYELDGRPILRERRTVKATVKPDGDYSFDWTGRFEALDKLAFTASVPKWDKVKGINNYCGYAGFSMRLAGNDSFEYAFTNALGSVNQRGYGDVSPRIDVYAKSKRTGNTTLLSFIADRPTPNYTLHEPTSHKGAGFYFIAFPEMFNTMLKMEKGERRDFHYVLEVKRRRP
ncbi:MAG: PmoA family protein, partial [Kiritimatiellae bacterium]|nr:PmoA family protein [Kiritimatiellia bacterium]